MQFTDLLERIAASKESSDQDKFDIANITDFLVYFRSRSRLRPMLVEVKPEENWLENWRELLPKWKAAWRYAIQRGWDFHIYDESRIRGQSLKNIQYLERFKNADYADQDLDAVIRTVTFRTAAEDRRTTVSCLITFSDDRELLQWT
uniref:Tn7 transposase TnsA N-terminal domain-containing protein n=1 Tax=Pseudomonas sp. TH31 TaxID=2796396 RepID=UPI001F5B1AC7|nr:Tn7 transposase TnsA N-terminal domain-containing protein [Pseudomonas sp. TH31]